MANYDLLGGDSQGRGRKDGGTRRDMNSVQRGAGSKLRPFFTPSGPRLPSYHYSTTRRRRRTFACALGGRAIGPGGLTNLRAWQLVQIVVLGGNWVEMRKNGRCFFAKARRPSGSTKRISSTKAADRFGHQGAKRLLVIWFCPHLRGNEVSPGVLAPWMVSWLLAGFGVSNKLFLVAGWPRTICIDNGEEWGPSPSMGM